MDTPRFLRHAIAGAEASTAHPAAITFSIEIDPADQNVVQLLASVGKTQLLASVGKTKPVWTREFDNPADRDAVVADFQSVNLAFYGRVTMIFGPATINVACDRVVHESRKARRAKVIAEALRRSKAAVINLYRRDTKHSFRLELQRESDTRPEWSVRYDRASERDRLCDWLRWQKARFGSFLDHAAGHGTESLTRMLVDEMFDAERRIKAEGRGAGGMRPLRMWRGD